MTNKDTLRAALEKAYLAGFRDSGEAYNGEHPEGASDKPDWAARRDKAFSIMGLDALAAKLGDGWQPIETAPKDGVPVDLWIPKYGRYPSAVWDYMGSEWGWTDSSSHGPLEEYYGKATHWRPLPDPPKGGEG